MKMQQIEQLDRRTLFRTIGQAACASMFVSTIGCSKMIVGTGKLLFGDPKTPSEFTVLTKEDLTKGLRTVLVVCSTPEAVEEDVASLSLDIIDGVTRRLKLQGVKTISPDRVCDWLDDQGGIVSDPQDLAKEFETDYIAWIDVTSFRLHEPNSPKLLRGATTGSIRVYKVDEFQNRRMAQRVYEREFSLTYPQHQPISQQQRGVEVFHKDYVKQLCDMLAERFYDHRPGTKF